MPNLLNSYRYAAGGNLFLDLIPGAFFGLSLRKLRTGVTNSIRLRRSSDNAEADIGFVGNDFDLSGANSFCSGTDGFVVDWYGQDATGRDFSQSNPTNQPQLYTSGSIATRNGEPEIPFTSTRYLEHLLPDDGGGVTTVWQNDDITVFSVLTHSGLGRVNTASGASGYLWFRRNTSSYDFRNNGTVAALTPRPTNLTEYVVNMFYDNSLSQVSHYLNNSLQDTDTLDSDWGVTSFRLGGNGNFFSKEFILYDSDQTSNLSTGNTNINDYYSIY